MLFAVYKYPSKLGCGGRELLLALPAHLYQQRHMCGDILSTGMENLQKWVLVFITGTAPTYNCPILMEFVGGLLPHSRHIQIGFRLMLVRTI